MNTVNGSNSDGDGKDGGKKLIRFPTLAERDRLRKTKERQEKEWRRQYKNERRPPVPFLNLSKIPPFTRYILLAFLLVHIGLYFFLSRASRYAIFFTFGFVPGNFTGSTGEFPFMTVFSPLTYQFIHGNWMHLLFNMIAALIMGMFFEREFGSRRTALFFFLCGLAGAALYFILDPFSTAPVIGASGSISGLFGAMIIILFQRGQGRKISKYGPWPLVLFWIVFMTVMGEIGQDTPAWQAHIGGFLAGIGLLYLMQKRKLFFR